MILTAVGVMLFAVATEFLVLPRIRRNLSKVSLAWLRAIRAVLVMALILAVLCAARVFLDWVGHGFPWRHPQDWIDVFAFVGALLVSEALWPKDWLNARIEGMRARAAAVEDRPDWEETHSGR